MTGRCLGAHPYVIIWVGLGRGLATQYCLHGQATATAVDTGRGELGGWDSRRGWLRGYVGGWVREENKRWTGELNLKKKVCLVARNLRYTEPVVPRRWLRASSLRVMNQIFSL